MQLQVIYCASNLSAFLKRSAVLYLSSPLHCNHWFVPAGNYGWASYCMSFSGWILQVKSVFQSHYCFVFVSCCFHVKHRNTSFLTFLFVSRSFSLFTLTQSCKISCTTGRPFTLSKRTQIYLSYLLSSVNCSIENGTGSSHESKRTSAYFVS